MATNLILQGLVDEISRLEEARDLLTQVWYQMDVHTGRVDNDLDGSLVDRLHRFFKFDDSE